MEPYLKSSAAIIAEAIQKYRPYATVLLLSGGDDSLAALHVCRQLGVKIDFIMHGVTGTGIKETHDFVKESISGFDSKYLEANAGDTYEKYVLRKGFFGVGDDAHNFTYHLLKWTHFRKTVSENIRHKKRGRPILFINGGRRMESKIREKKFISPIKVAGPNIWVNIINEWPNDTPAQFLEGCSIKRNPVSKLICRSGECNCGTALSPGDRVEIGFHFPAWKKWIDDLSNAVYEKGFTWEWGTQMPKGLHLERKGQMNMFAPPMMCQSCVINYKERADGHES